MQPSQASQSERTGSEAEDRLELPGEIWRGTGTQTDDVLNERQPDAEPLEVGKA